MDPTRRFRMVLIAVGGLCIGLHVAEAREGQVRMSPVRQLFVDDTIIAEMRDVRRVFHQPKKHPRNPVVRGDHPWEAGRLHPAFVWHDPAQGVLHMWYKAVDTPIGDPSGRLYNCYARSRDGVRWEKPKLGLYSYRGSRDNNIVCDGRGLMAAFLNPAPAKPDEKFLGLWEGAKAVSLVPARSADGIRWQVGEQETGDLRSASARTPPNPRARYFFVSQCWAGKNRYGAIRRGVMRCDSEDLLHWGGYATIFQAGPDDPPDLEFYTMSSDWLVGRGYQGIHPGFLHYFHADPNGKRHPVNGVLMSGPVDVYLAMSRDTAHWERLDRARPFLPRGPEGSFDSGMVFLYSMVALKDRLLFYYGGFNLDHGDLIGTPSKPGRSDIGLATLRLDGFVSIESKGKSGWLTTKPFVARGQSLHVNVDGTRGAVAVEVLDEAGHPLDGFTRTESRWISQDGLHQEVSWPSGGRFPDLRGKLIRLRFHLRKGARLYAFEVR